ncbi:MAG TPA: TPM domain-containing protein [Gemmatimonadales bacterium]|nr:TPM domain-containing protein [Gemmatimonadales bacterium]
MVGRLLLILQALTIPAPRGYVSDFAGVLDSASIQKMTAVIEDLKSKTGGEIAVVTLPDLQGREAGDVALEIGRQWGVGQKGNPGDPARNRGIVILLVPRTSSHKGEFFIATGTGSEGIVTDAEAGRDRDAVMPQLRNADYNGALVDATALVAQRFANEFHVTLDPSNAPRPGLGFKTTIAPWIPVLFIIFVGLTLVNVIRRRGGGGLLPWLILSSMSGRRNRWGGWGGGGGFGGFGGFGGGGGGGGFGGFGGGGGFSGGGAGGSF